jgi:hypothetical protein
MLRGSTHPGLSDTREASAIQQRCGLGNNYNLFADLSSIEIGSRGFTTTRSTGEHDTTLVVPVVDSLHRMNLA